MVLSEKAKFYTKIGLLSLAGLFCLLGLIMTLSNPTDYKKVNAELIGYNDEIVEGEGNIRSYIFGFDDKQFLVYDLQINRETEISTYPIWILKDETGEQGWVTKPHESAPQKGFGVVFILAGLGIGGYYGTMEVLKRVRGGGVTKAPKEKVEKIKPEPMGEKF